MLHDHIWIFRQGEAVYFRKQRVALAIMKSGRKSKNNLVTRGVSTSGPAEWSRIRLHRPLHTRGLIALLHSTWCCCAFSCFHSLLSISKRLVPRIDPQKVAILMASATRHVQHRHPATKRHGDLDLLLVGVIVIVILPCALPALPCKA